MWYIPTESMEHSKSLLTDRFDSGRDQWVFECNGFECSGHSDFYFRPMRRRARGTIRNMRSSRFERARLCTRVSLCRVETS
jgi:hypothetical protein